MLHSRTSFLSLGDHSLTSHAARLGLEELLAASGGGREYNANLIPKMRSRFSSLVLQAVNEQLPSLALEIYAQTEALPQTQTEQALSIVGYKLIKPWAAAAWQ